ncbi:MAG: DSD1 family PLP-dependent enzyme [Firmicutes bacterium]|jgi:D-serine deaminase-like pyridoxal phosphate-dependent protein|nr:DSD1 family PLP-dependent enzyme [Bacillota bacterium]
MAFNTTRVGAPIDEIETPALLIDLDKFEANIERMARFFEGVTANLRPHAKTHKTPIIAHKQIAAGAHGITCAKLSEAEVMAKAGIRDILIANQIIGESKILRLMGLTRHTDIIVAVDNMQNAQDLSDAASACKTTLNTIIEVDVGMTRSGTRSLDDSVRLARALSTLPGLRFRGIMGYEGHTVYIPDLEKRRAEASKANHLLVETRDAIVGSGMPVEIVSAGGTGTYDIAGTCPGITEIQAGSYIMMDTKYQAVEGLRFEQALTLLATVISRPTKDRAVLDVGLKGITKEFGMPTIKEITGAEISHLSEEHAKVDLNNPSRDLKAGDKVELIPSHCCTTINLHDTYYGIRNGAVETVWDIAARGGFV